MRNIAYSDDAPLLLAPERDRAMPNDSVTETAARSAEADPGVSASKRPRGLLPSSRIGRALFGAACLVAVASAGSLGFLAMTPYGGAGNPFEAARTCAFFDSYAAAGMEARNVGQRHGEAAEAFDLAVLSHACREAQYAMSAEFFRQPPRAWIEKWLAGLSLREPVDRSLSWFYLTQAQHLYRLVADIDRHGRELQPAHIVAYAHIHGLVDAAQQILGLKARPAGACGFTSKGLEI